MILPSTETSILSLYFVIVGGKKYFHHYFDTALVRFVYNWNPTQNRHTLSLHTNRQDTISYFGHLFLFAFCLSYYGYSRFSICRTESWQRPRHCVTPALDITHPFRSMFLHDASMPIHNCHSKKQWIQGFWDNHFIHKGTTFKLWICISVFKRPHFNDKREQNELHII